MYRSTRDWNSSSTTTYRYDPAMRPLTIGTRQSVSTYRRAKSGVMDSVGMNSAREKSKCSNHSWAPATESDPVQLDQVAM